MGKRRKTHTHDDLIRCNARKAAEHTKDEASCPYIYDLRARKIWLKAFREEIKALGWMAGIVNEQNNSED